MSDEVKSLVLSSVDEAVQFLEQLEFAPYFYAVKLEAADRKTLHQYFEKTKTIGHKSIRFSGFGGSWTGWKKCYECGKPTPALSRNYHYGIEPNNKDESIWMECYECGYSWSHECNYDDYDYCVDDLNTLVFGKDLHFRRPKFATSANVSVPQAAQILVGKNLYIIAPFKIQVRKRQDKFTKTISDALTMLGAK